MSKRKFTKTIYAFFKSLFRQIWKVSRSASKKLANWLARRIIGRSRKRQLANAGFVLPTVAMVSIVVVLLSLTLLLRSFDRAENANTVRVNQQTLASVTPALDRARAKLNELFVDPTLPRSTPTEVSLNLTLEQPKYDFEDEKRLKLTYGTETLNSAWKFEVDTNGDGVKDSIGLYGIYFRTPKPIPDPKDPSKEILPVRNPLQARTPPMPDINQKISEICRAALGTSSSLVGTADWYKVGAKLSKSFFIYAAIVPKGENARNFTALEMQQDRGRIPLTNNAIVYEDDLQITPGKGIKVNGRIFTNSNLLTGSKDGTIDYYQVSSPESCFYQQENSKIIVGGNLAIGTPDLIGDNKKPFNVDLYQKGQGSGYKRESMDEGSVTQFSVDAAYDSAEYANRIANLVSEWLKKAPNTDPSEVVQKVAVAKGDKLEARRKALENYFKDVTRRVPYSEAIDNAATFEGTKDTLRPKQKWVHPVDPANNTNSNNSLTLNFKGDKLYPAASNPELVTNDNKEYSLGDRFQLGNGLPAKLVDGTELPLNVMKGSTEVEWDKKAPGTENTRTRTTQITSLADLGDTDRDGFWEEKAAEQPILKLDGVGGMRVITGAGVFSRVNSFLPEPTKVKINDPVTPEDETQFNVVWPDTMPMWQDTDFDDQPEIGVSGQTDKQGDLKMRATVVYHYAKDAIEVEPTTGQRIKADQKPIACISSYYDPSTKKTAMNRSGLPDISQRRTQRDLGFSSNVSATNAGNSHNGVSYNWGSLQSSTNIGKQTANSAGLFTVAAGAEDPASGASLVDRLKYQANLVYPDGRFVNEQLRSALKLDHKDRNLANQAAIDSTICSLKILDGSVGTPSNSVIPHGAIYETSFLDGRQLKALEGSNVLLKPVGSKDNANDFDLPLEDRQPLEIRATVLDLDLLRRKGIGDMNIKQPPGSVPKEYLLPNSGIIYASRDDALPDLSDTSDTQEKRKLLSPQDGVLDSTRRPNGIMLINGSILARKDTSNEFIDVEKGLILVSNLPTYVQADETNSFNKHQTPGKDAVEEFSDIKIIGTGWSEGDFYGRKKLEGNFACRKNDPRLAGGECNNGDLWRPATVLADSVTLLSNNFNPGFRTHGDYDLRNNTTVNNLVAGTTDASGNLVPGYDITGDDGFPGTKTTDKAKETDYGIDLNGNGIIDPNTVDVPESQITLIAARQLNGFFENSFATSADSFNPTGADAGYPKKDLNPDKDGDQGSSYLNNFVTPVQRRANFTEYVMEICRKLPVSSCQPSDWVVGYDFNGNGSLYKSDGSPDTVDESGVDLNGDGDTTDTGVEERAVKASALIFADSAGATAPPGLPNTAPTNRISVGPRLGAGTTGTERLALDERDRRYPRRIAFRRDITNSLLNDTDTPIATTSSKQCINGAIPTTDNRCKPVPLALNNSGPGQVIKYPYSSSPTTRTTNALWYRTVSDTNPYTKNSAGWKYDAGNRLYLANTLVGGKPAWGTAQPLLVPVLQIHNATGTPGTSLTRTGAPYDKNWLMPVNADTTFNLVIASGDTTPRVKIPGLDSAAKAAEPNGGYANFARFMEAWKVSNSTRRKAILIGSTIQFKRSAYGDGPFTPVLSNQNKYPLVTSPIPTTFTSIADYDKRDEKHRLVPTVDPGGSLSRFQYVFTDSGYKPYLTDNGNGQLPYYTPPDRESGYDVGLLSQMPDLFAARFTTPPVGTPRTFYREVNRNDPWIQTLLCAKENDTGKAAIADEQRPKGCQ